MLPNDDRNPFQQNPWKLFINTTSETIPPFAVMRITGSAEFNGAIRFTVAKPNSTTYDFYLVNGPYAVPAGKDGICTTLKQAGYIAYDSGDGTPALAETWGPESGSWLAHKNQPGFWVTGGVNVSAGQAIVPAIQSQSSTSWLPALASTLDNGTFTPSSSPHDEPCMFHSLSTFDGTSTFELDATPGNILIKRTVNPCIINGWFTVSMPYRQNHYTTLTVRLQFQNPDTLVWSNGGFGDSHTTAWPDVAVLSGAGANDYYSLQLLTGIGLTEDYKIRILLTAEYSGTFSPDTIVAECTGLDFYYQ